MKVISTENRPLKLWLDDMEDGALEQARNLANLPFVFKHVAIMPDSHQGYGMPIGGVMATRGVIIPNAVGVDIGCGMCAVKTSLVSIRKDDLKAIMGLIRERVPVGFDHHKEQQNIESMPDMDGGEIVKQQEQAALYQVGTLGGGNHFIEIQQDSIGCIWVMIHSGSRNLGYKVAKHYNDLAINLNRKWHTSVPEKWQLAFLPLEGGEADQYIKEMNYCVEFAKKNRESMLNRVIESICDVVPSVGFDPMINIAHNYAAMENHFGTNVMVHRKGATRARKGEIGIIPGSQGTASYIVEGLGNPDSFMSCSHGAGRRMGRKQAKRELSLADEKKSMDDLGIVHSVRSESDLDEAPGAYKDIAVVMENQSDLVKPIIELHPLGVIKG